MDSGKINFNQLSFEQKAAYVRSTMQNGATAKTSDIVNEIVKFSEQNIEVNMNELPNGFKIDKTTSNRSINSISEGKLSYNDFVWVLRSMMKNLSSLSYDSKKIMLTMLESYLQELKSAPKPEIEPITIVIYGVNITIDADTVTKMLYEEIGNKYNNLAPDEREAFNQWSTAYCPECLKPDYSETRPQNYMEILQAWYDACNEWMASCAEGIIPDQSVAPSIPEPILSVDEARMILDQLLDEYQTTQAFADILQEALPEADEYNRSLIDTVEYAIKTLKADLGPKSKKINNEIWTRYDNFVKVYDHSGRLLRTEPYDEGYHGKFD